MSGPYRNSEVIGAIGSFTINEYPEINGQSASFRIDFFTVNDESVFELVIAGKVSARDVSCPGRNVSSVKVCKKATIEVKSCS